MRRLRLIPELQPRPRRGAILVFAMIALLVVSMIGASLMRTAILSLRQLQREQLQLQTAWLADSGCQRALFRLHRDSSYTGEDWAISADQLKAGSALVHITIAPAPDSKMKQIVTVVAHYPEGTNQQIRISRQMVIPGTVQEEP
jgi:type II secretory pathway component PulK